MLIPAAVLIAGAERPGFDAWLEALCGQLAGRGLKVGVLAASGGTQLPGPMEARAVVGPGGLGLARRGYQPPGLEELLSGHFEGLDVVLCSTFLDAPRHKLEFAPQDEPLTLAGDANLKAVVCPKEPAQAPAWFRPQDPGGVAEFIAGQLIPARQPQGARVLIAGKRLPIKEFVQEIVANTIRAMLGSLKGGDRPGPVHIYLD